MVIANDGGQIDPPHWDMTPLKKGVNASELHNVVVAIIEHVKGVQ